MKLRSVKGGEFFGEFSQLIFLSYPRTNYYRKRDTSMTYGGWSCGIHNPLTFILFEDPSYPNPVTISLCRLHSLGILRPFRPLCPPTLVSLGCRIDSCASRPISRRNHAVDSRKPRTNYEVIQLNPIKHGLICID